MEPVSTPEPVLGRAHILLGRDERYRQFCTPWQWEVLEAIWGSGSQQGAADLLKRSRSSIRNTVSYIAGKASVGGYSPDHGLTTPIAPGYVGRGHSTLYKVNPETGDKMPVLQWEKTKADEEARQRAFEAAVTAACEQIPPTPPAPGPRAFHADLLNLCIFTDFHLGMRAWSEESGEDWDLEKAEELIIKAFAYMIRASPPAAVCFIAQMGDFLHFDGLLPVTPTSRHVLDASSQFQQIVRAAVRILRRLIAIALEHHDRVVVLAGEGNHDLASAPWQQALLSALYEHEPRVEVIDTPRPYYAYQWGQTMLAVHHGHLKKKESLPELFAAMYPEIWGRTTKRYAHSGHYHHEHVPRKGMSGMLVHQHPTLAPNDAHSTRAGYVSERQTRAITYHKAFGEASTVVVTPEMLLG